MRGRDLRGHVLLGLQPARIDVDEARKLGEPHHAVHGLVGDMRLAHERHHVVLAMGVEGDVAHQHEVVVLADLAEGAVEHLGRTFAIAAVEFLVGVDHALWRVEETLAVGIVAGIGDERAHRRQPPPRATASARPARAPRAHARTGSAFSAGDDLGQGLTTASIDGLSVRPVLRGRGCHRGGRISHTRLGDSDPCATTGRRIPILHGFHIQLRVAAKPPRGPKSPSRAGETAPIYSFTGTAQSRLPASKQPPNVMLNEVYNSRILELAGNIPRLGRLSDADATATAHSKLCGSTVTVDLKMEGDTVTDFSHDVKACALGQASSSIMARNVIGAKADELRSLRETVRRMLKENGAPPERQVGRHRGARAGARLQGAPCLHPADLRCGDRRDRSDRSQAARPHWRPSKRPSMANRRVPAGHRAGMSRLHAPLPMVGLLL